MSDPAKVSKITTTDGVDHEINAATVNDHTIAADVPSTAVFTDEKVTQTESTTNAEYEVTFAGSTGTTTTTEGVGKSQYFKINPSKKAFTFGSRSSGTVGDWSVAIGSGVIAGGDYSHAEGRYTAANGNYSHSEGIYTAANGNYSHCEGRTSIASGVSSHAEGDTTIASGDAAHAEGLRTTANHLSQHVFGEYNIADPSTAAATARGNYVEIVGNGTADDARSNARTLDWSGNEWLAGTLNVGVSTGQETIVMRGAIGGTDHETDPATFLLSTQGAGTGKSSLLLRNRGSDASSIWVKTSDIELRGTDNTWDGTNTSLKDAISSLNSSKLGTSITLLASLAGTTTETQKTLISALSNFNWLLLTLDTGQASGTISCSTLIPRLMFNGNMNSTIVTTYPTDITGRCIYVSDTKVKFKMSDNNRGIYLYGIN